MFLDIERTWVQRPLLAECPKFAGRKDLSTETADRVGDQLSDDRSVRRLESVNCRREWCSASDVRNGDLRVTQTEQHVQTGANGGEQQAQYPGSDCACGEICIVCVSYGASYLRVGGGLVYLDVASSLETTVMLVDRGIDRIALLVCGVA